MSALGYINPIDNPQAWDTITVGDTKSPGMCVVGEVKRHHEWDVKKGKGVYGSTITYVGRPPAKGSIKFFLWTAAHFSAWDTFYPLLKYDPTKTSVQAVGIYHPSLDAVDISSIVVESIGNPVIEGEPGAGLYSIELEYLEYFPPPKTSAVSTPTTASTATDPSTPGDPPDPVGDANETQIGTLMNKAGIP